MFAMILTVFRLDIIIEIFVISLLQGTLFFTYLYDVTLFFAKHFCALPNCSVISDYFYIETMIILFDLTWNCPCLIIEDHVLCYN